MGKDSKELLLLNDLYARIPYGVKICYTEHEYGVKSTWTIDYIIPELEQIVTKHPYGKFSIKDIRPYLRPMSSMTEEEIREIKAMGFAYWITMINNDLRSSGPMSLLDAIITHHKMVKLIDWLNRHHFDYRGLIEKGLAIEAPEGMYE